MVYGEGSNEKLFISWQRLFSRQRGCSVAWTSVKEDDSGPNVSLHIAIVTAWNGNHATQSQSALALIFAIWQTMESFGSTSPAGSYGSLIGRSPVMMV